ncbi:6714_t:CDS:1, partial [Gigaspora rosea]
MSEKHARPPYKNAHETVGKTYKTTPRAHIRNTQYHSTRTHTRTLEMPKKHVRPLHKNVGEDKDTKPKRKSNGGISSERRQTKKKISNRQN